MIICPAHNMLWYGTAIQKNWGLLNNSPPYQIRSWGKGIIDIVFTISEWISVNFFSNYVYWEIGSFDFVFPHIFEFPHQCLKNNSYHMWCSEKLIKKWNLQGIVGASFDTGMAQIIVSYVVSFILMRVYPAFVSVDNKPWVLPRYPTRNAPWIWEIRTQNSIPYSIYYFNIVKCVIMVE